MKVIMQTKTTIENVIAVIHAKFGLSFLVSEIIIDKAVPALGKSNASKIPKVINIMAYTQAYLKDKYRTIA